MTDEPEKSETLSGELSHTMQFTALKQAECVAPCNPPPDTVAELSVMVQFLMNGVPYEEHLTPPPEDA